MHKCFMGKRTLFVGNSKGQNEKILNMLLSFGAKVYNFSLPFQNIKDIVSILGDVRNNHSLEIALQVSAPEIIFYSLQNNVNKAELFETNIMGTVNLLELSQNLESLNKIIILSDNNETNPIYKASKDAAIIVAKTYEQIFKEKDITLLFKDFTEI